MHKVSDSPEKHVMLEVELNICLSSFIRRKIPVVNSNSNKSQFTIIKSYILSVYHKNKSSLFPGWKEK